MSTRKIMNAKDLSTNELIYFRGHAKATYMSDGTTTVEDAINNIEVDLSDYATKEELGSKQDKLLSGTNIKTINGESILGGGDINIPPNLTIITYNELRHKALNGLLDPGQLYAITDYNTLVNQSGVFSLLGIDPGIQPLEHHNILIVEATSIYGLSDNAKLLRYFEPLNGEAWSSVALEQFGYLQDIQEIDVKYDPYWHYDTEAAFEKSKVTWVPRYAYDSNTNEAQGVFYTYVIMDEPSGVGPIFYKQFLTYTGVNFLGQIGENGATQIFWEFASGDSYSKYYLQSNVLRQPNNTDIAYIITKPSTEEGQNNILGPCGQNFNDTTFTGYIYHAKDKWGNEAPYDFGCILKDASWVHVFKTVISKFSHPETSNIIGNYINNSFSLPHFSTFAFDITPAILIPFYYQGCWKNNVIKEVNVQISPVSLKIEIDFNFIHVQATPATACFDNYIGKDSNQVVMTSSYGNIQNNNIAGGGTDIFMLDSSDNKIGYGNSRVVTIGYNNTIGYGNSNISLHSDFFGNNTISNLCSYISIYLGISNKIGSNCQSISFERSCFENIIEDSCSNIIFGSNYSNNTIHAGSLDISFRKSNSTGDGILKYVRFCNIGKKCRNMVLYYPGPMDAGNYVQNIEVEDGINFNGPDYKFIEIPAIDNDYKIRVGNDTLGVTKVWNGAGASGSAGSAGYPILEHFEPEISAIIAPNMFHVWGVMSELSISLEEPEDNSIANEYVFQFISSDTGTTLTLPPFQWSSEPVINPNCTYQVSILNNCVTLLEFAPLS